MWRHLLNRDKFNWCRSLDLDTNEKGIRWSTYTAQTLTQFIIGPLNVVDIIYRVGTQNSQIPARES